MYSLRTLSAARFALILLLSPLFAFLLGYAVSGTVPHLNEIIGGVVMLLGIAVPSLTDSGRAKAAAPSRFE